MSLFILNANVSDLIKIGISVEVGLQVQSSLEGITADRMSRGAQSAMSSTKQGQTHGNSPFSASSASQELTN